MCWKTMTCKQIEEFMLIEPDQVPKMLPAMAKLFPLQYKSLYKAFKELRSAKRELYFFRGFVAWMSVMLLLCPIIDIVKGKSMSLWDVLEFAGYFVVFFVPIFWGGIVSCQDRVNTAKADLEKELKGMNPELFKALYKMINQ